MSEDEDIAKEIEEVANEGLAMSHDELAIAYACPTINWNTAISERDEARRDLERAKVYFQSKDSNIFDDLRAANERIKALEDALRDDHAEFANQAAAWEDEHPGTRCHAHTRRDNIAKLIGDRS